MGIPAYFSHIVRKYRSVIKPFNKAEFLIHNLYLDCNSIIYDSVRHIPYNSNKMNEYENKLIINVCDKLHEYINIIKPTKNVIIAFDGVAPVAKLEQQRNRRYKSWFTNNMLNRFVKKDETWDTTKITPGTIFMANLGIKVERYFRNAKQFGVENIIVSGSDEVGEGEHKIYEYIRSNKDYHKETRTVIYGLDADLIMLSLNHLRIAPEIYLYRETPHFIRSIDKTLNPDNAYLLDMPKLAKYITKELNNGENAKNEIEVNRLYDYIFLCFLLGNDFIPHFPALNIRTNGINYLLEAYNETVSKCGENLTDGEKINWAKLRLLIDYLSKRERDYLLDEYRIRDKYSRQEYIINNKDDPEEIEKKFQEMPIYYRAKELYIDPKNNFWEDRYYNTLFDVRKENVSQICINYLEALEWTMKYYTVGCPDWRWSYQYHYSPLLSDLIKYIPYFDNTFIKENKNKPIEPKVQLSYVLPRSSLYLLPESIHKSLKKNYSELYKDNWEFEWSYCKYFWESHAIMPHIDIKKLEKIVNSYYKT